MKPGPYDRWGRYVQEAGPALTDLLREQSTQRDKTKKVCLILGRGFDPRMLGGLQLLREVFDPTEMVAIVLVFDEGPTSPSRRYDAFVRENLAKLKGIIPNGQTEDRRIQ